MQIDKRPLSGDGLWGGAQDPRIYGSKKSIDTPSIDTVARSLSVPDYEIEVLFRLRVRCEAIMSQVRWRVIDCVLFHSLYHFPLENEFSFFVSLRSLVCTVLEWRRMSKSV